MDVMTALRNEGAVSPAATLQEHIARAMRAVREQATTTETDPIGPAGRYALWRLADPGIDRVVETWLGAHRDYWAAGAELADLAADDGLRAGRHQLVYDAGLRWRRTLVAQRRAAIMGAARTAQRALMTSGCGPGRERGPAL